MTAAEAMAEYGELVATAAAVLGSADPGRALEQLEWDARPDVADASWAHTFGAVFEAQGRTLARTPALGRLLAAGYGMPAHAMALRERTDVAGRREVFVQPDHGGVVLDVAGTGVVELELVHGAGAQPPAGVGPFDDTVAQWRPATGGTVLIPEADAADRRTQAEALGRIAIAHELLGAATGVLDLAVQYAKDREQFGRPIGSFQAVQHILAEAEVERRALLGACRHTMRNLAEAVQDPMPAAMLKALAGRSARRIAQATLQSFGAIGFTWEHDHHRYQRRMLTLDALLGSVDELRPRIAVPNADGCVWRASTF